MEGQFGRAVWKGSLEGQFGRAVWVVSLVEQFLWPSNIGAFMRGGPGPMLETRYPLLARSWCSSNFLLASSRKSGTYTLSHAA